MEPTFKQIKLKYCEIRWTEFGCEVEYQDGSIVSAWPHDEHHYYVISHRCGYGDDVLAYCREHEFVHEFLQEKLAGRPSQVLFPLAHERVPRQAVAVQEEALTQMFQRYLRGGEEPIIGGVDWAGLKREALDALD